MTYLQLCKHSIGLIPPKRHIKMCKGLKMTGVTLTRRDDLCFQVTELIVKIITGGIHRQLIILYIF